MATDDVNKFRTEIFNKSNIYQVARVIYQLADSGEHRAIMYPQGKLDYYRQVRQAKRDYYYDKNLDADIVRIELLNVTASTDPDDPQVTVAVAEFVER